MYIAEITLAGRFEAQTKRPTMLATISRKPGDEYIKVLLISDQEKRDHFVSADCQEDVYSMAQCLQYHLDECQGTNSMVQEYYQILQRFMD